MPAKGFVRNFQPFGILSEGQIESIFNGALEVLERTGVAFEGQNALEIFEKGGVRVDYDTRQARIPRQLVQESLQEIPKSFSMQASDPKNNIHIDGTSVYFSMFSGLRTVDLDTWETCIPTVEDNHTANKVADGLEYVHLSTSYTPYCEFVGVSPAMNLPVSTWSRLKYFNKISRIGSAVDSHIFEVAMAQAAEVDVYGAFEASPPLTFTKAASDCGIACAQAGFPVEPGCGGIMGGSHPATISGSLVTGLAEVIAAAVLVQLVNPGNPIIFNSFDIPQNMRTGSPRFGSISISLFQVAWNQIWRTLYGIPTMNGGGGCSDSKAVDYQLGYEKAVPLIFSAISGASVINNIGGLTGELSYHPAVSVLDNDLSGMVGRFLEGIDTSPEAMAIDLIAEVGPIPGFYLDKKHTRQWWRKEQFIPIAASDEPFVEWVRGGKKTALDYARERADELLAKYQPVLSPEKDAELDRILAEAEEYYRGKGMIEE